MRRFYDRKMTVNQSNSTWKWRSLVSFYLVFAGIVVLVSGLVLYVAPPGRVGNITSWHLLGLDKQQWAAAHTISCFMVAIFGVLHLLLNWKTLTHYLWDRTNRTYQLRDEMIIAALLTIAVFMWSVLALPPFSAVMDIGDALTDSWDTGIVDSVISENHDSSGEISGGWGQFTVEELCVHQGLSVEEGVAYLAEYGIAADESSRIRTLADTNGYAPSAVVDIIQGLAPGTTEAAD